MENEDYFCLYEEYDELGNHVLSRINGEVVSEKQVRKLSPANIVSITTRHYITPSEAKNIYNYESTK